MAKIKIEIEEKKGEFPFSSFLISHGKKELCGSFMTSEKAMEYAKMDLTARSSFSNIDIPTSSQICEVPQPEEKPKVEDKKPKKQLRRRS